MADFLSENNDLRKALIFRREVLKSRIEYLSRHMLIYQQQHLSIATGTRCFRRVRDVRNKEFKRTPKKF